MRARAQGIGSWACPHPQPHLKNSAHPCPSPRGPQTADTNKSSVVTWVPQHKQPRQGLGPFCTYSWKVGLSLGPSCQQKWAGQQDSQSSGAMARARGESRPTGRTRAQPGWGRRLNRGKGRWIALACSTRSTSQGARPPAQHCQSTVAHLPLHCPHRCPAPAFLGRVPVTLSQVGQCAEHWDVRACGAMDRRCSQGVHRWACRTGTGTQTGHRKVHSTSNRGSTSSRPT